VLHTRGRGRCGGAAGPSHPLLAAWQTGVALRQLALSQLE